MERHWDTLRDREVRFRDATWALTGDVDVREDGGLLAVTATRTDDVRHGSATLYFELPGSADSLNPGRLGDHFDRLERRGDRQYLVVETPGRTYRYRLRRVDA